MLSFSIAPILDGLIHLVAFLLECFAFYLLLRVISRNRFEHSFWRTIAVVAAAGFVLLATNPDAVASPTEKPETVAMTADFTCGMELFAERKAWMDSLTPEERQAYREEMSAFMAEQGLAEDRDALSAIQQVNPTNLVLLASMFAELQAGSPRREESIRAIPESLAAIAENLTGFTLSEADMGMLRNINALLSSNEGTAAIAQARAIPPSERFLPDNPAAFVPLQYVWFPAVRRVPPILEVESPPPVQMDSLSDSYEPYITKLAKLQIFYNLANLHIHTPSTSLELTYRKGGLSPVRHHTGAAIR